MHSTLNAERPTLNLPMTSTGPSEHAPRGSHTCTAWLLFAPPFTFAALRWWTRLQAELEPASWQPLRAADAPDAAAANLLWQASLPFALTLAALTLAGLILWVALRRFGWRRVRPVAVFLWVFLWLGAVAAAGGQHLNRAARQALPPQTASVLQARAQAPTERGVGGAEVLLRLPGFDAPQSVLLELAQVGALPPGTRVQLALARGRFGGHYVTGWQLAPP